MTDADLSSRPSEAGHVEKLRQQEARWEESRDLHRRAFAHLALISSGAILVSVNSLGPLAGIAGNLRCLSLIFVSWTLLLIATVSIIPYQQALSRYTGALARYLDFTNTKMVNELISTAGRKQKLWAAVAWIAFLTGMLCLLIFVGINLLGASP